MLWRNTFATLLGNRVTSSQLTSRGLPLVWNFLHKLLGHYYVKEDCFDSDRAHSLFSFKNVLFTSITYLPVFGIFGLLNVMNKYDNVGYIADDMWEKNNNKVCFACRLFCYVLDMLAFKTIICSVERTNAHWR